MFLFLFLVIFLFSVFVEVLNDAIFPPSLFVWTDVPSFPFFIVLSFYLFFTPSQLCLSHCFFSSLPPPSLCCVFRIQLSPHKDFGRFFNTLLSLRSVEGTLPLPSSYILSPVDLLVLSLLLTPSLSLCSLSKIPRFPSFLFLLPLGRVEEVP